MNFLTPNMTRRKAKRTGKGMVLTERDRQVVTAVTDFQVLQREQLVRLGLFGSKTRANVRLLRLTKTGYLSRRYLPAVAGTNRALYYPGPLAGDLLGRPLETARKERARTKLLSDLFLEHQLRLTDVRLSFLAQQPLCQIDRWLSDVVLRQMNLPLIPDAYIEYRLTDKSFAAFIEFDRGTETLTRWDGKARGYLSLAASGRYQTAFNRKFFRVLVLAHSTKRLAHLRSSILRHTDRIFWFTTLAQLVEAGPFGHIWFRPRGDEFHSLTES